MPDMNAAGDMASNVTQARFAVDLMSARPHLQKALKMQLRVEVQVHLGGPCRARGEEAHDSVLRSSHDLTTDQIDASE